MPDAAFGVRGKTRQSRVHQILEHNATPPEDDDITPHPRSERKKCRPIASDDEEAPSEARKRRNSLNPIEEHPTAPSSVASQVFDQASRTSRETSNCSSATTDDLNADGLEFLPADSLLRQAAQINMLRGVQPQHQPVPSNWAVINSTSQDQVPQPYAIYRANELGASQRVGSADEGHIATDHHVPRINGFQVHGLRHEEQSHDGFIDGHGRTFVHQEPQQTEHRNPAHFDHHTRAQRWALERNFSGTNLPGFSAAVRDLSYHPSTLPARNIWYFNPNATQSHPPQASVSDVWHRRNNAKTIPGGHVNRTREFGTDLANNIDDIDASVDGSSRQTTAFPRNASYRNENVEESTFNNARPHPSKMEPLSPQKTLIKEKVANRYNEAHHERDEENSEAVDEKWEGFLNTTTEIGPEDYEPPPNLAVFRRGVPGDRNEDDTRKIWRSPRKHIQSVLADVKSGYRAEETLKEEELELIRKYIEKEAEHLQQAGPGETGAILELGAAIIQRNTDGNRPVNRLSAPEKSRLRAREETGPRAREETRPRAREEACPRAREGKPSKDVRPIRDENTAQGLWDDDDNFIGDEGADLQQEHDEDASSQEEDDEGANSQQKRDEGAKSQQKHGKLDREVVADYLDKNLSKKKKKQMLKDSKSASGAPSRDGDASKRQAADEVRAVKSSKRRLDGEDTSGDGNTQSKAKRRGNETATASRNKPGTGSPVNNHHSRSEEGGSQGSKLKRRPGEERTDDEETAKEKKRPKTSEKSKEHSSGSHSRPEGGGSQESRAKRRPEEERSDNEATAKERKRRKTSEKSKEHSSGSQSGSKSAHSQGHSDAISHAVNAILADDDDDDDDDEDGDDIGSGRKNKRRKRSDRKKKDKKKKRKDGTSNKGDDRDGDADDGDEDEPRPPKTPGPSQIKFYTGEELELLRVALFYMRLYLLAKNAYPNMSQQYRCAEKFYIAACKIKFGPDYKNRMPKFTGGMSKLIRDETWVLRGKVKRIVISVVDRAYGLHPSPETYTTSNNPSVIERERRKFIQQKVSNLLSKHAPFLCGTNGDSPSVPFGHPAIAEVVGSLAFCPKTTKQPLASIDLKAFDPIPLPIMAYACAGLRYALDEYKTGVRVKAKFTEVHYAKRYRKYLRLMKAMQSSRSQGHLLDDIRDAIMDRGRALLRGFLDVDDDSDSGPFIPSSDAEIENSLDEGDVSASDSEFDSE